MSQPHPSAAPQPHAPPVSVNVNVNVHTGGGPAPVHGAGQAWPAPHVLAPAARVPWIPPPMKASPWWKSARFWFFALPFATGGLASWVPPLWVASKVREGQLKGRLYVTAAVAGALALLGGVLTGSAPQDSTGNAPGARDDIGVAILLLAIAIGTGTALVHRHRVFPSNSDAAVEAPTPPLLPGVQEAQARRDKRAQYRRLATDDAGLAREMNLGRPDLIPALDDGGLLNLNALDAAAIERYARVTSAEAASIVGTRDRLGRLSSVDELVVHGDLTLPTAERLREYAVFLD